MVSVTPLPYLPSTPPLSTLYYRGHQALPAGTGIWWSVITPPLPTLFPLPHPPHTGHQPCALLWVHIHLNELHVE